MAPHARASEKQDLRREHREEYRATDTPSLVKVAPALYLSVVGKGKPGGPKFTAAIGSLYRMAYTLKFRSKAKGRDFKVPGLEGLWDLPPFMGKVRKSGLATMPWRLVLRVPEIVTRRDVSAVKKGWAEKGEAVPSDLTLERIREGNCMQRLHIGPYSTEYVSVRAMESAAGALGFSLVGPLHEIYLSDPRKVPPARLKTILRISLKKKGRRAR